MERTLIPVFCREHA